MLLPAKALILYQIIFIYIYLCRTIIPQTGSFLLFSELWRQGGKESRRGFGKILFFVCMGGKIRINL